MKLIKKTPLRKKTLLILVPVVLLGLFALLEGTGLIDVLEPRNLTADQRREEKVNDEKKKNFLESDQQAAGKEPGTAAPDPAPPTANPDNLRLSARQEDNSSVTILSKLYNYSNGKCDLLIKNSGKTVTQTADIIYQTQFSTCAGFSVLVNELGTGTWNIKLTVTSNGLTDSKVIPLEVK